MLSVVLPALALPLLLLLAAAEEVFLVLLSWAIRLTDAQLGGGVSAPSSMRSKRSAKCATRSACPATLAADFAAPAADVLLVELALGATAAATTEAAADASAS